MATTSPPPSYLPCAQPRLACDEFPELLVIALDSKRRATRYVDRGLTGHTMRAIITGLWLRLPLVERIEIVEELHQQLVMHTAPTGLAMVLATSGQHPKPPEVEQADAT